MVRRAGIGGTIAAATIFSVLLISNFVVLVGAQQYERFTSEADGEHKIQATFTVQSGAAALDLLDRVQDYLNSRVLDCDSYWRTLSAGLGNITESRTFDNLNVSESLSPVWTMSARADNMSLLSPFNGEVRNGTNFSLKISASGSTPTHAVSFRKTETHYANLPLDLSHLAGLCNQASNLARTYLNGNIPENCTSSTLPPIFDRVQSLLQYNLGSGSIDFTLNYSLKTSSPCSVAYVVNVTQWGVLGPEGDFTLRLRAELVAP